MSLFKSESLVDKSDKSKGLIMIQYPESYNGSAIDFIRSVIIKSLPPVENTIYWNNSVKDYLGFKSNIRIVRKFLSFKDRGEVYESGFDSFTVSDNEPALWMYMNSFEQPNATLSQLIDEKKIPISFIKKRKSLFNSGKQKREKEFSQTGLKHCHIFDCSPKGENLNTLSLDQRMIRLFSPMNHFPFPNPNKYEMNKDFGEDIDFRLLVIKEVLKHYYKTDSQKNKFIQFINDCGESIIEKEINDFKIQYAPKTILKKLAKRQRENSSKTQTDTLERKNFILSKTLYGKGKTILIKYDSTTIRYNHDEVFESVKERIISLPCWKNYGYYTKSKGIPNFIDSKLFTTFNNQ
jgi:hypothetical protein